MGEVMSSRIRPLDLMDRPRKKKLYFKSQGSRRKIKKTNYWTSSWKPAFVISQVFFKSSVYFPTHSRIQELHPFISVDLVSGGRSNRA